MVQHTLQERERTHGSFAMNARIAQSLKDVIHTYSVNLHDIHKESLDLMCTKIACIISGDPYVKDHWHNIAGYATLGEGVEYEGE